MRGKAHAYASDRPCHTCTHRTWRSLHGFLVMGCGPRQLRFGIAPDIRCGHVNKPGGCVPMPSECRQASSNVFRTSQEQQEGAPRK